MKYFKVVRRVYVGEINDWETYEWQSAIHNKEREVTYEVGEWTSPKQSNGPLAAFDNLRDAKQFAAEWMQGFAAHAIFECSIRKSKSRWLWYMMAKWEPTDWWNKNKRKRYGDMILPEGTVLATRIKLNKLVLEGV